MYIYKEAKLRLISAATTTTFYNNDDDDDTHKWNFIGICHWN